MTWSEKLLWGELRKLDANIRRQAPIGPYIVDFAAHGPRLVIEVDGGVHERLDEVALRDGERQLWLQSQGYRVVRFTDHDVENDPAACAEKVRALVADGRDPIDGEDAELKAWREWMPAPDDAESTGAVRTPPSPSLPPSRRKGV
jgi:very-short-patch-repair endonuclease